MFLRFVYERNMVFYVFLHLWFAVDFWMVSINFLLFSRGFSTILFKWYFTLKTNVSGKKTLEKMYISID